MNKIIIILLLSVFVLSSCGKQTLQKIVKSDDYELKYSKATELYNAEKYSKAIQLYEQLVPRWRGSDKGEEVHYQLSLCHFHIKDYMLAGYRFREFTDLYPTSEFAEDALFKSAYCYYLDAPVWSLDQEITTHAISELELFISRFPKSNRVDSCNVLIDDLRGILQTKSYENAILYYNIGYYRAAYIALENSLKDYPESDNKEKILYFSYKSNFDFANKSIKIRQEKRFQEALERYHTYVYEFPAGTYSKDVEKFYKTINKELEKFNKSELSN